MAIPLTYELETLETIIKALLFPSQYDQPTLFDYDGKLKESFRQEIERIKKCFIREVFAIDDDQHLQRFIHFHQQELIRILDYLQGLAKERVNTKSVTEQNILHTIRALDELLGFIENHFTRYFDQGTKAPENYVALAGSEIVTNLSAFQEELRKRDAEVQLITLVLGPLRKFVERIPSSKITYREIIYTKEIAKELRRVLDQERISKNINEAMRFLLIYLNYNTISYFDYFTLYLNNQVRKLDGTPQKIEQLSFLLKEIKQTQTKQGIGYHHLKHPIKEQLIDWLGEELTHLEKSYQLTQRNLVVSGPVSADFKVQTDLSLSQLAYLLRIFVDSKMVINKNLSEVLRFISRAFQVKNQNILYESFRVRYYNPEESIRKSVRSLLLQLVDYINQNP